jgi:hypothetical protein
MNIHIINRHPAELEAEAMLSREQPYLTLSRWRNARQSV